MSDLNRPVGGPLMLAVILFGLLGIAILLAVPVVFDLVLAVPLGWLGYIARVGPQWRPDGGMVATGVSCLIGFVAGSHLFLRWVYAATGPQPEPRRWPLRWTLHLCGLVVLMFVYGVAAIGMFHQTGWLLTSPEPLVKPGYGGDPQERSRENLLITAKASHNFASGSRDGGELPVSTFDAHGRPMHSWQIPILPFMSYYPDTMKPDLPWDHPDNRPAFAGTVREFLHPAAAPQKIDGYGASHYAGNAAVVMGDRPKSLARPADFPAGAANTIWVGEAAAGFRPWADPLNARDPRHGVGGGPDAFGSPVRGARTQFAMCDASVRTFDPKELAELMAGKVPE